MRFARLVDTARQVARRGRRLAKIEILADLLTELGESELGHGVAMLSGELPTGKIGVGPSMLRDALAAVGDGSDGAERAPTDPLTVERVVAELEAIRDQQGAGSQNRRRDLLTALLLAATDEQRDFLARLIVGELRQGALAGLMTEAVARAFDVPAPTVRRAAMLSGDLSAVAEAARRDGEAGLRRFRLELFRPIQPMLASPVADIAAVPERLSRARSSDPPAAGSWSGIALELKIDGARVQVHRHAERVRVYSRQLNDVTASVPEVVEAALALPVSSVVLDGETFGVRPDGSPVTFQETMRRFGRRLDVERQRREQPLAVAFFDCLLLDDAELIDLPLLERSQILERICASEQRIPTLTPADAEAAERFFDGALDAGHEGLMAKDLGSVYEAGSRGFSWLKVKPAHTLDLVVLGVEWGSGRRQGWLSNLHLGARDEHGEVVEPGGFVMLGKTFKGLTDQLLEWQTDRLKQLAVHDPDDGWVVTVRPELVVEIAFSNVQASPHYPAGMALRFARVKRYREDKDANQASTLAEVREHFERGLGGASDRSPSEGESR